MPFDQQLAQRLRKIVDGNPLLTESRAFGGFGYTLDGKMCFGIHKQQIHLRVGKPTAAELARHPDIKLMDFTTKVMPAWVTAENSAIAKDDQILRLINQAISFVQTLPSKK